MPTRISPGDLQRLYADAVESGATDSYRKRRWRDAPLFASWLEEGALAILEPEQALRLYRASGGRDASAFGSNPIEEIRDSLDFLLYDTIKLEGRFDECANDGGAYRLAGAGKEFASWLLCLRNPFLFAVWNSSAERMLRGTGAFPEAMKRGPMGIRYLDLLEALAWLRSRAELPDFIEVDVAAYLVARSARKQSKSVPS